MFTVKRKHYIYICYLILNIFFYKTINEMMLLFGSIWKSTLYYAYKRHERKVSIIFNVIEQRIFSFQFSFYCLPTVMAGVGYEGCAKRVQRDPLASVRGSDH